MVDPIITTRVIEVLLFLFITLSVAMVMFVGMLIAILLTDE